MRTALICCGVVLWGMLAPPVVPALGQEAEVEKTAEWAAEGRHELGSLLGISDKEKDTGFSAGPDYEYRLSRKSRGPFFARSF